MGACSLLAIRQVTQPVEAEAVMQGCHRFTCSADRATRESSSSSTAAVTASVAL